jgi:hypothetical protein
VSKPVDAFYSWACAAMSPPVRFNEWKFMGSYGQDGQRYFAPMGLTDEKRDAAKEFFTKERWIYVFRFMASVGKVRLSHEIHFDGATRNLALTPMVPFENARAASGMDVAPDPAKRGAPEDLGGPTIRFPRRIRGEQVVYYFLATRVRLPAAQILEIEQDGHMHRWLPPVTFEPDDPNVLWPDKGSDHPVTVPVVDPITVAMHLHGIYRAALEDYQRYTTNRSRMQKVALANVVHGLVEQDMHADRSQHLFTKIDKFKVEALLDDYDVQCQHRTATYSIFGGWLADWLHSPAMKLVQHAHLARPEDVAGYLVPYCLCLTRAMESAPGRAMLRKAYADDFVKRNITRQIGKADYAGSIKDMAGATLPAVTQLSPIAFEEMKDEAEKVGFFKKAMEDTTFYREYKYGDEIVDGFLSVEEIEEIEGKPGVERLMHGNKGALKVKDITRLSAEQEEVPRTWEGSITKVETLLKGVNTVLAVSKIADLLGSDEPGSRKKAIWVATAATLEIAQGMKTFAKISGALGFIAGLMELSDLEDEEGEARAKGDTMTERGLQMQRLGTVLSLLGNTVKSMATDSATAAFAGAEDAAAADMFGVAAGTAAEGEALGAVVGGMIMSFAGVVIFAGVLIALLMGESDIELFLEHCEWGNDRYEGDEEEGPSWSRVPYPKWRNAYGEQLYAFAQILCDFDVDDPKALDVMMGKSDPREAFVKMGWVPSGGKLELAYVEKWDDVTIRKKAVIGFDGDGKARQLSGDPFEVFTMNGLHSFKPRLKDAKPVVDGSVADGFDSIHYYARLSLELGGGKIDVPRKPKKVTMFDP